MQIFLIILTILGFALFGYVAGSIPFGVIIGHFYHKDPTQYGSKNSGGTNVGRTISRFAGALTIVLDGFKLLIPFVIVFCLVTYVPSINEFLLNGSDFNEFHPFGRGNTLVELSYYIVLLAGFIGHSYSIFLKLKGGKIVSTYLALIFGTTVYGFMFPVIFLTILKIKKYVSLSSICMAILFTIYSWIIYFIYLGTNCSTEIISYMMWFDFGPSISIYFPIVATIGAGLLIFKHKDNINRLKNHEESKVTWVDDLGKNKK